MSYFEGMRTMDLHLGWFGEGVAEDVGPTAFHHISETSSCRVLGYTISNYKNVDKC